MSKRGKSRGRASWPSTSGDGGDDRNGPNWPYGPSTAQESGPSRRGRGGSSTPGPKQTFVREVSPEFVPGPEPEPEETRPISPNESMLFPSVGRPRLTPCAAPFNAAPFSPNLMLRGNIRPMRRPGASPTGNRGARPGSKMPGTRMFRGPPPQNLQPIDPASSRVTSAFGSGLSQVDPSLPSLRGTPRVRGIAKPQGGVKSTGKGRRGGVKASSTLTPVEIALDSDDDDLEIIDEKRLTHKPVEKSPLEILVEQHKAKGHSSSSSSACCRRHYINILSFLSSSLRSY